MVNRKDCWELSTIMNRAALKKLIEDSSSPQGRAFELSVQVVILVWLVAFSIDTLPDLSPETRRVLGWIEVVVVGLFTVEYLLRLYVADRKLGFVFSFFGIVDLLAILRAAARLGLLTMVHAENDAMVQAATDRLAAICCSRNRRVSTSPQDRRGRDIAAGLGDQAAKALGSVGEHQAGVEAGDPTGLGLPPLLRHVPVGLINLPHREHWLAPERKDETLRALGRYMAALGAATVALFLFVFELSHRANLTPGGRLSNLIWLALGLYFPLVIAWIVALFRRFRAPS